ncbi:MAG: sulfur carrier protein ThiS adenylyltransferase ThiF [Bacillota bacterium]
MNEFERALGITLGKAALKRLQEVRIGIAGAGGLGSNCAQLLVRSGFKKFKIVDFDTVDQGNLNRQFYFVRQVGAKKVEALRENLLLINPDLELEVLDEKITAGLAGELFADCQAVVEALDGPGQKRMVVEAYMNSGRLLVAASGLAGWGRSDDIRVHRVTDNFYIVGDLVSEVSAETPALAAGVAIAAAKQADIVFSYFLGQRGRGYDG